MRYLLVSRLVFTWLVFAAHALAQVITTVAATAFTFPSRLLPAINAPLGNIFAVATDAKGNVYGVDAENNLVVRIAPDGTLTVVAGNGTSGFSGDGGPATSASLNQPTGVAADSAGNLYIADYFNNRVRKVSGGIITTFAGNGIAEFSGDGGPATSAALFAASGVAVDPAGNVYIAEYGNNRLRKVSAGIITTIAGNGTPGFSGDGGPATSASLNFPQSVAVDSAGNLYIADTTNNRIRKVSGGIISTFAGTGKSGFSGDGGPATSASLNPSSTHDYGRGFGVAIDSAGSLYIADVGNNRIRKVSGGIITTIAGDGTNDFSGDGGPATGARLSNPEGLAVDSAGSVYIADTFDNRIRKVSGGIITTIAGDGGFQFSGDGEPATSGALQEPLGVAVDSAGNLYIADTTNSRIRKVSGGIITTVAGNGEVGFSGDGGPGGNASLYEPSGVAVDSAGNLYIADFNNRIREVSGGIITTIAGDGNSGFSGDGGPASKALINHPSGVAVDSAGNLYIADTSNNRIRKVSGGTVTTVAGNGKQGFSGDGGPATAAAINPSGIAIDSAGALYIAETFNFRIRKVSGGIITTIAGNGAPGFSGDGGPATKAALSYPSGVTVDSGGNVYISDYGNSRIRKVSGGIISTVAGNGTLAFSGDGGPATNAALNYPSGVTVDSEGNLYIADTGNDRVRVVLSQKPIVAVLPPSLSFSGQSVGPPAPIQSFKVTSPISGVFFSSSIDSSSSSWLTVSPSSGASPALVQVTANPSALSPGTYNTTIAITTPDANPATSTIAVTFTVSPGVPPSISIDKPSLSFPFPRSGTARSQSLTLSNTGSGPLSFTIIATTSSGGNWLSVMPESGSALPGAPVTLLVTANPTGLAPQTYTGKIMIASNGGNVTIPVTMTISTLDQAILLSQSGLSFTAISQGGIVPPQTFAVKNIGTGVVPWTVTTTTLSGGNWLVGSPTSGSSDASVSAPIVQVSVNAASLAPGKYYGLVQVDAPTAANSPQVLTVFLNVLAAGSDQGALAQPSELVFTTTAGAEAPGSQNVLLYNVTASGKSYRSALTSDPGLNIVVLPTDATLDPQQPSRVVVQPFTQGLDHGVYNATLALQFDDGRVISVRIQVIVAPANGVNSAASPSGRGRLTSGVCTPTKLLPAILTLSPQFQVPAGPPIALLVDVSDDCTNPQTSGAVTVSFSNGDPSLNLQPVGDGRWEATWNNSHAASQITLTVSASDPTMQLTGTRQVNGTTVVEQDPPLLDPSGVVSSATAVSFTALAPGGLITLYGSRLSDSTQPFTAAPLPKQLGDARVIMAGQILPLLYASPTQINAEVPEGININTTQQVYVLRGLTYSVPVPVDVAPAQPSLFNNGGQVIAQVYRGSAPPFLASPQAPATAGDVLVLYGAGLGVTTPAVLEGVVSPASPLPQAVATTVTIGGQPAPVSFAGLAPGFVGLYQINTQVPSGVATGDAVAVVVKVAGQTSPAGSLAVQ